MKVSACLIIKNEELNLDKCLSSIVDYVDEIIITDTGSTDNSIQIAQKYTDKIYHFQWCDNFAKARNYCQQYATGEYILWLDADEFFYINDIKNLRKTINDLESHIDFIDIVHVNIHKGLFHSQVQKLKVIKNNQGYKWIWKIHEIINYFPSDNINSIYKRDIKIYHNLTIGLKKWNNINYFIELFPKDKSNMTVALKILNYYLIKNKNKKLYNILKEIPYIHPIFIKEFIKFSIKLNHVGLIIEKNMLYGIIKKSIVINKKLYT